MERLGLKAKPRRSVDPMISRSFLQAVSFLQVYRDMSRKKEMLSEKRGMIHVGFCEIATLYGGRRHTKVTVIGV